MRFLLKTAFWLALIAFFLPSATPDDADHPGVNYLGAFVGAQEAISDMSGFCERSPAACAAGKDVGAFVAARVGDGIAYAYSAVQDHQPVSAPGAEPMKTIVTVDASPASGTRPDPAAAPVQATDPMQTAAVAAELVRRAAGLPPFGLSDLTAAVPEPAGLVPAAQFRLPPPPSPAIPTPAPRV